MERKFIFGIMVLRNNGTTPSQVLPDVNETAAPLVLFDSFCCCIEMKVPTLSTGHLDSHCHGFSRTCCIKALSMSVQYSILTVRQ